MASLVLAGCIPDEHGHLAARRHGDLISPPVSRVAAMTAIEAQCGTNSRRGGSPLGRRPYVQSLDEDSAFIVWTSIGPQAEHIEVRRNGELVARQAGRREPTEFLTDARQYVARIDELSPATTYCYSLVNDHGVVFGPSGFRTAPAHNEPAPVDVLVFGDSGSGNPDQWALRDQMATVPIDLIIHTGDVAYPRGSIASYESYVFRVYDGLFDHFPFFPSPGNHDYKTADAGPYREVFVLPENGGDEGRERYYSFDWGPIHFVALDTERTSFTQAAWLQSDLARTDQPWKIVYSHEPPYSSGAHGSSLDVRALFTPILERFGVQLMLSGHDHDYERMNPMNGVQYVVTGGGGASTRKPRRADFTAFTEDAIHFVQLHVGPEELRGYAIDASGQVFDSFRVAQ